MGFSEFGFKLHSEKFHCGGYTFLQNWNSVQAFPSCSHSDSLLNAAKGRASSTPRQTIVLSNTPRKRRTTLRSCGLWHTAIRSSCFSSCVHSYASTASRIPASWSFPVFYSIQYPRFRRLQLIHHRIFRASVGSRSAFFL